MGSLVDRHFGRRLHCRFVSWVGLFQRTGYSKTHPPWPAEVGQTCCLLSLLYPTSILTLMGRRQLAAEGLLARAEWNGYKRGTHRVGVRASLKNTAPSWHKCCSRLGVPCTYSGCGSRKGKSRPQGSSSLVVDPTDTSSRFGVPLQSHYVLLRKYL
jgi:hypothetical protein